MLDHIWPGVSKHWNGKATFGNAQADPNILASYSAWLVGQCTTIAGREALRQGNVHFAGEHTSVANQGFMEGGAESGMRAAGEILSDYRHQRYVVANRRRNMMRIVGTAGHVDHGKSSLVRALTGTDPDRWREEQLRGMTLDLGFAHLVLDDGLEAGIVDVPGHERFLHNMLAGAAGMDVLLLVISAAEGVMPQTLEHLEVLGYLNVRRTIVVTTKSDLVDADGLRDAIRETAAERCAARSPRARRSSPFRASPAPAWTTCGSGSRTR